MLKVLEVTLEPVEPVLVLQGWIQDYQQGEGGTMGWCCLGGLLCAEWERGVYHPVRSSESPKYIIFVRIWK